LWGRHGAESTFYGGAFFSLIALLGLAVRRSALRR
jgi:hypothetical protein